MTPARRQLGLCALALLALNACAQSAPSAAGTAATGLVWVPLQAHPGGGLQRLSLDWTLLQAAPADSLDSARMLDAQGQVLPSAWAGTPAEAASRRSVEAPLWAWPDAAGKGGRADIGGMPTLAVELDEQGRVRRVLAGAGVPPAQTSAAGSRHWLADLSALKGSSDRLLSVQLDWAAPPQGQVLSVQLEGSDDARQWEPLPGAQLLDLPATAVAPALRLRHIDWPAGQAVPRYLRLHLDAPVPLRSAALSVESRQRPGLATQPLAWQPEAAPAGEAPRWRLDLPLPLRPEALRVQLPALNQLLSLRLEQRRADGQAWQPVHRFVAWRMQRQGVEAQSPAEPLQAAPARHWRLVAEGPVPAGMAEAALPLHWQWRPPQLVSLLPADPALLAGLRLQFGAPVKGNGRLALQTVLPDYQPGSEYQLPELRRGPVQSSPAPASAPAWEDPATRQRWGLWAVLGVSVLALAGLAWRLKGELGAPPG